MAHAEHAEPPKVLVVDDEPHILSSLQDLLEKDFVVLSTVDAGEALDVLQEKADVAVIVSDQRMPGLTGDEFLKYAREISDAARILITGYADIAALARAVNDGQIYAYVAKPWNPADLKELVRRAAAHAELQRALDEERRLLAALMENVPDLIYFKDEKGRFLRVNRAEARFLGLEGPEQAVGRTLFDLLPPTVAAVATEAEKSVYSGEAVVARVDRVPGPSELWYESTIVPIRGGTGSVEGLVGISRDVSTQRTLEADLRQAQKMEAVGTLAGGVAHDFNNLLTAILGYCNLGLTEVSEGSPLYGHLDEIRRAGEHAASLTRQLLAYSRKQVLTPERLDLNAVVTSMEAMLRRLLGETVDFEISLSPSLAPVHADRGQVEQVILNLAVNARDAMPRGGTLTIETANAALGGSPEEGGLRGPHAMLRVSDTGVGMDEGTRGHIFEPFFTTKEPGKGTGLGLATVYGIVKQSGGHIAVESAPGRGCSFRVYLPNAERPATSRPISASMAVGGSETILLVEDEPAVRALAASVLRHYGYEVLQAASGPEALQLASGREGPIDLVVSDIVLKGMSGPEMARKLQERRPGLAFLFMSGYTSDEIVRRGLSEDGNHFLQKPFSPKDLARKVRAILDSPSE